MNVEYINPFIQGAQMIIQMVCLESPKLGKIFIKQTPFIYEPVSITIGLTGQLTGAVLYTMSHKAACLIASKMMMGMPVAQLDDMSKSAISELTNMISGNVATTFFNKDIAIDITPPTIYLDEESSRILLPQTAQRLICIPLSLSGGNIFEIDIYLPGENI